MTTTLTRSLEEYPPQRPRLYSSPRTPERSPQTSRLQADLSQTYCSIRPAAFHQPGPRWRESVSQSAAATNFLLHHGGPLRATPCRPRARAHYVYYPTGQLPPTTAITLPPPPPPPPPPPDQAVSNTLPVGSSSRVVIPEHARPKQPRSYTRIPRHICE